jgi:pyruvate/2-oxoglutarate dehydrogenase complex dihydrolipoamide dehydrogenase (E3) component
MPGDLTWIVGAGNMAVEHAKVLAALGVEPEVIGRSEASAQRFTAPAGRRARAVSSGRWRRGGPSGPSWRRA